MIPYLDHPELKFGEKESTEMPFRYVKGKDGKPIMPEVSQTPSCSSVFADWQRQLTPRLSRAWST